MSEPTIHRSERAERDILTRYDELVQDWPLPVDESDLASRWGALGTPDLQVETLESSHLVAVERANEVDALLARCLGRQVAAGGA